MDHMDELPEPQRPRRRRLATAGVAAGLVATGLVGGAVLGAPVITGAQSTTTSPETTETPSTEAPAEEGARAPGDHLRDALQPLVDDGTLTTEQMEAVITALQDAHPAGGQGPGGQGPGGHRGPDVDAAAEALGLTAEEVRQGLMDGSSLADLAAEQGVDPQVVIDALVASMDEHLDEEVAAGELTQEEADARMAETTERITAMVNGEMPARGMGGPGGHHGRGFPGDAAEDDSATDGGS